MPEYKKKGREKERGCVFSPFGIESYKSAAHVMLKLKLKVNSFSEHKILH